VSAGRRPALADSAVATGKGDDGTTGLLFGGLLDLILSNARRFWR